MKKALLLFTLLVCCLSELRSQTIDTTFGNQGTLELSTASNYFISHDGGFWVQFYITSGLKFLKYGSEGKLPPIDSIFFFNIDWTQIDELKLVDENKILFRDNNLLKRAISNGNLDPTFGQGGTVNLNKVFPGESSYIGKFQVLPDRKILALGSITKKLQLDGEPSYSPLEAEIRIPYLLRLLPDGRVDSTFGPFGKGFTRITNKSSWHRYVHHSTLLPNGGVQISTREYRSGPGNSFVNSTIIYRLTPDGILDTSSVQREGLRIDHFISLHSLLLKDGGFILVGNDKDQAGYDELKILKFSAQGELDPVFLHNFSRGNKFKRFLGEITSAQLASDESLYLVGQFEDSVTFKEKNFIYKFLPDGKEDLPFGEDGLLILSEGDLNYRATLHWLKEPNIPMENRFIISLARDIGFSPILYRLKLQRYFLDANAGSIIHKSPPFFASIDPSRSYEKAILLQYELTESQEVEVTLFDFSGKKIATLFEGNQDAGTQIQQLSFPEGISSGYYILYFRSKDFTQAIKTVLHP